MADSKSRSGSRSRSNSTSKGNVKTGLGVQLHAITNNVPKSPTFGSQSPNSTAAVPPTNPPKIPSMPPKTPTELRIHKNLNKLQTSNLFIKTLIVGFMFGFSLFDGWYVFTFDKKKYGKNKTNKIVQKNARNTKYKLQTLMVQFSQIGYCFLTSHITYVCQKRLN